MLLFIIIIPVISHKVKSTAACSGEELTLFLKKLRKNEIILKTEKKGLIFQTEYEKI